MADLPAFREFVKKYQEDIDFVFVYIWQAHSHDWPIGTVSNINQHTSLEDRIKAAEEFEKKYQLGIPILIDPFEGNPFNTMYATWPHRIYIIFNGQLVYIEEIPSDGIHKIDISTQIENFLFREEIL